MPSKGFVETYRSTAGLLCCNRPNPEVQAPGWARVEDRRFVTYGEINQQADVRFLDVDVIESENPFSGECRSSSGAVRSI